jgi:excisionase family DNA binding protein
MLHCLHVLHLMHILHLVPEGSILERRHLMAPPMSTLTTTPRSLTPEGPVTLSEQETQLARQSGETIAGFLSGDPFVRLTLSKSDGTTVEVSVPTAALRLLTHVLAEMARGNPVTLIPRHAELTTHQAAEVLRVSRPYLIKLLDQAKIPHRKVGAHRRVRYEDLLAYQEGEKMARRQVLDEMTAEAERLGLYE